MAVGLTLIFGVMRVVNFAHGDMMVWGMYLAWILSTRAGIDPYVGFIACAGALFVMGWVTQRLLVDRIVDAPHEMQILLMLGVALVLENAALVAFGPDPQRVRSPLRAATFWLGPVFVDVARLVTFALAMVLTLALYLFLTRTDLGRTMRAAADNAYGALVIGTDVRRVYAAAFGIGAACVGAAGALVSPILPFQPAGGLSLSVASFNIVIIGGMGSLPGAFLGGLLVSVAESLGRGVPEPVDEGAGELLAADRHPAVPARGALREDRRVRWLAAAALARPAAAARGAQLLRGHRVHLHLLLRVPRAGLEHRGRLRGAALGRATPPSSASAPTPPRCSRCRPGSPRGSACWWAACSRPCSAPSSATWASASACAASTSCC